MVSSVCYRTFELELKTTTLRSHICRRLKALYQQQILATRRSQAERPRGHGSQPVQADTIVQADKQRAAAATTAATAEENVRERVELELLANSTRPGARHQDHQRGGEVRVLDLTPKRTSHFRKRLYSLFQSLYATFIYIHILAHPCFPLPIGASARRVPGEAQADHTQRRVQRVFQYENRVRI